MYKQILACLLLFVGMTAGATTASGADAFTITPLDRFMEPENLKPGDFAIEKIQPGLLKITPKKGQKSVRLELKEPVKIRDDSAWFSIPYYPVASQYTTGYGVTLNTQSGLGENNLSTSTSTYRRDFEVKRGWQNLISEWTLLRFHESRRKGMKATALIFTTDDNMESFYFATPKLYGGDILNPALVSDGGGSRNTWYGEMTPIRPFLFRSGAYECGLTIQSGYQKAPIYETSRSFDFGPASGPNFNPVKALEGFELPVMPQGVYWCTLKFRDATGALAQQESFAYQVMASPVQSLPEFADQKPTTSQYLSFIPVKEDFIFDAGGVAAGKIQVAKLSGKPWFKENSKLSVHCRLAEFLPNTTTYFPTPEKIYAETVIPAGREGATLDLSLPISDELAPANTAFFLKLDLMIDGKTLDSASYVIGARGKNNDYTPLPGKIKTWQEVLSKPIIGEGAHPGPNPLINMLDQDRELFLTRLKEEGNVEYVDVNCMWSAALEPLPGFYTFGYVDRYLEALHRHGLKAIMHTTSIHPEQPVWSVFDNKPSKVHDGRFTGISPFAQYPGDRIKELVRRVGQRYAKEPTVGFWMFWGYFGEGFYSDWIMSWRFGGGKMGYDQACIGLYRDFIKQEYKTISALNAAYGTQYADWSQIPPPPPPVGQEAITPLRNLRPAFSLPYEDFKAMKEQFQRDWFEGFLVHEFRKMDPVRPLALYYYCDAETDYLRSTPEFFLRNPGIIQRNGGNEIVGVWNKQYMHFRAYENTPTMSEDVSVYGDTVKDWEKNVFNGARIGKLGVHFFNYRNPHGYTWRGSKYNTPEIDGFFSRLKAHALPLLGTTEPLAPEVAVFYDYYDSQRTLAVPGNDLFYSRYLAEPLNDRFLSRLEKHYRVLFMDSGANILPQAAAQSIVQWVKNGGSLVMTPATAAWQTESLGTQESNADPVRAPLRHDHYLLRELGIPLPESGMWGTKIKGQFLAQTSSEKLFPKSRELRFYDGSTTYIFPKDAYPQAETLARFTSPSDIAGQPAALMFSIGKGKVILLAQYPRAMSPELYDGILEGLQVKKHLAFRRSADNDEPPFRSMLGYALKTSDGSRILMMQHSNNAPDPHFTPGKLAESEPFERRVVTFGLPEGQYDVFDLMDENRLLGTFTSNDLATSGVPARFRYNELKIYRIVSK